MRIYLADLGHNLLTFSSDVYPLGIANLATYATAFLEGEPPEISIFREPQDLKKALDAAAPDILALSCYAWNEELSHHFARYAKGLSPEILTCMGGPNYPLTEDKRREYLAHLSGVDVFVEGPTYEGERAFLGLLRRWREVGGSIAGLREEPVPGLHWLDGETLVKGPLVERIRDLDEIPSPYLAGLLDPFLQTGYFPMMQISRGCPFSCTYCNSGVRSNNKVFAHSIENVKADMVYIAERIKPETALCFADDNFGMYERDEEIAEFIGWMQDKYGWPHYLRTTTGKNRTDRIVRVMRKTRGALPMTAAVQSMNPVVLKNIKRANIKLETYMAVQEELGKQGMQSYGELILCLPGETRDSFMTSVKELLAAGAKRISAHQLMLLKGAEMDDPESRERFQFDTRFRIVARNIGDYTGEPVIEVEEMVVQTPDFSFDDYLYTRVFHLLLTIFHYEGNFDEPFAFARQHGVQAFDVVKRMKELLEEAPAAFRAVIDDFVRESQEELFDDRESCLAWAREHYEGLVDGSLGGNLLSKYSMIGRFFATQPALDTLEQVLGRVLTESGADFDPGQLAATVDYLRGVMLHVPFAETMAGTRRWKTAWDVESWTEAGCQKPLAEYRFAAERELGAEVDADRKRLIESKLEMFGEHPSGLGKFTRTMFARDLRRSLVGATARS